MKTHETGKEKQPRDDGPSSHCGDFRKMAEIMESFCSGKGDSLDCCFGMMRTLGKRKAGEGEEAKETRKTAGGRDGA